MHFDHVSFRYKKEGKENVLKDINLSIHAGETIGIIGGTGSAKSSLVNLISRLYDVSEGSVKVGGIDVRNYDMEVLRNQVAVVLQKNVLFSGKQYRKTFAGEIKRLQRKSVKGPVSLPAQMNLSRECQMDITLILSRAVPMYPVDRSRDCVLPEHFLKSPRS